MKTLVKGTRLTFSLLNFALEVIEQGFRMVANYSRAAEEKLAAEEQRLYAHIEKVELMLSAAAESHEEGSNTIVLQADDYQDADRIPAPT